MSMGRPLTGWPPTGKKLKGSLTSTGRHSYPRAITASSTCAHVTACENNEQRGMHHSQYPASKMLGHRAHDLHAIGGGKQTPSGPGLKEK